jgi:hypothetical protein
VNDGGERVSTALRAASLLEVTALPPGESDAAAFDAALEAAWAQVITQLIHTMMSSSFWFVCFGNSQTNERDCRIKEH